MNKCIKNIFIFKYAHSNRIFIIVLFRIYLIGKMMFIFLKIIHGFIFLIIENIFLKISKYLI